MYMKQAAADPICKCNIINSFYAHSLTLFKHTCSLYLHACWMSGFTLNIATHLLNHTVFASVFFALPQARKHLIVIL